MKVLDCNTTFEIFFFNFIKSDKPKIFKNLETKKIAIVYNQRLQLKNLN